MAHPAFKEKLSPTPLPKESHKSVTPLKDQTHRNKDGRSWAEAPSSLSEVSTKNGQNTHFQKTNFNKKSSQKSDLQKYTHKNFTLSKT